MGVVHIDIAHGEGWKAYHNGYGNHSRFQNQRRMSEGRGKDSSRDYGFRHRKENDLHQSEMIELVKSGDEEFFAVPVTTANGKTHLIAVVCEITGKQIGWQSFILDETRRKECQSHGYTPAFVSLKVVDKKGNVKVDLSDIETF